MLSDFFKGFSIQEDINKLYHFPIKGSDSVGTITLVKDAKHIDQEASRSVLVESFIGEYEKYLSPNEIDKDLVSWREVTNQLKNIMKNISRLNWKNFLTGI